MSREAFSFINKTPILQSLLYDLNLLPEQLKEGTKEWDYMMATVLHFQACEAEQSKRIAEHEEINHDLVHSQNLLNMAHDEDCEKYEKQIAELKAQNAELVEALQKHGRHLDDCAVFENWIDAECNCGLFKLLNKTKECLAEQNHASRRHR